MKNELFNHVTLTPSPLAFTPLPPLNFPEAKANASTTTATATATTVAAQSGVDESLSDLERTLQLATGKLLDNFRYFYRKEELLYQVVHNHFVD